MNNPIEQVAQALLAARREHVPADAAPLADALTESAQAFAVQDAVARGAGMLGAGFPRYWKTGATGRDGVAPHAALPPAGVWPAGADARAWPFHHRLIEAEIALRLGRDVAPAEAASLTEQDALALVDAMTVSIELVDFRWRQAAQAAPLLKLADLQSHGALVLGEWQPFQQRDWARQLCVVKIGSGPEREFRGTHSVGDPARLFAPWLRHASRHGDTVPAGTIVTTGTWCGMLQAAAGDLVTVRFEGVGQASVQL